MHFLVIRHLDIEPSALIGETIMAAGHLLSAINLNRGETLPDASHFDGVVIMGGPQSANDEIDYIKAELAWVKDALAAEMPMLGICLGAQIMAKAAGAEVYRSPVRELGWYPVYRTLDTAADPLFGDMPDGLTIFHWHGETFSISDRMCLLATHPDVPAQAFRLAPNQYGLQFHIEVHEQIIDSWIDFGASERECLGTDGTEKLHANTSRYLKPMQRFCIQMVTNWLDEILSQH
ncbi:GMP synthase - Glutamine amidotransferase [Mariprofundus ferrinatatus]|uniref:GMP synthase-Glutamine amidotransferase n=1 Tax=Mariprofundus ferrinatatus TaxID=1921087 RepID=A0A2K8L9B9_9PROT|nr:type 1 glutamine amidotransferase [Mariprofundus ferrinatatus]ATX81524.1 GMP synthase - Glutamine amidotransferase [Mariprofundus ferrinatatus]